LIVTVFYLLRHGHANYELAKEKRLGEMTRHMVPLTPQGIDQVEQIVEELSSFHAETLVSSPITRALQSAALLSRRLDLPLEVEFDLHEWISDLTFTHDQEGLTRNAYREMISLNGEWPQGLPRNWEPLSSVMQRVRNVLCRYCSFDRVIVVCHGVIITGLTGKEVNTGKYKIYTLDRGSHPFNP
jgi:broad specificity phosphatase PhoE